VLNFIEDQKKASVNEESKEAKVPSKVRVEDGEEWAFTSITPPPRAEIKGERSIKITEIPSWAQPAFKGAVALNRIQSKVYPVAFESN
jgi:pre-mRNA-splicing helicase BRR2